MHRSRHTLLLLIALALGGGSPAARADEIPVITLTESGPNQEVPTHRSFYVAGDASVTLQNAQAIVVRKGSPSVFGGDGPDCHDVLAALRIEVASSSASADDEDDDSDDDAPAALARYPVGMHRAFELFPRAEPGQRDAAVLVSAPWQRTDEAARQYRVLVPHDAAFFSAGYSYCMFVVATQRAQELDDASLSELVDGVARKIVACGDRSSCDDEALADYETRVARELETSRTLTSTPAGAVKTLAGKLAQAARTELGAATGIVEALDRMEDRWHDKTTVMTPSPHVVWAELATDPLAQAVTAMLARLAALLPQVRVGAKSGTTVALFTTDGKVSVRAVQVLDDGRSIRVASSKAPASDQTRVLTTTTDELVVSPGLTLRDLIELGASRVRVEREWITLGALGDRVSALGLETWSADDTAYLVAATAQVKRLSDYVERVTRGVTCSPHAFAATEAEQDADAIQRHLGEWLACQHADPRSLASLAEQLGDLVHEDGGWKAVKDKLVARSKRIVTVTATAPLAMRVELASRTWVFSYVTPMIGYAGVLRPGESFGLFYVGAQLHLDPNPADDVLWRDGITTTDLRRAVALEIGVAPARSAFGPDQRFDGPGGLPPVFFGLAVHVVPYTSFTFGGSILDRKHSTLPEEQPHTIFAPYVGFTLQLNVPDLIRQAAHPSTHTTATR